MNCNYTECVHFVHIYVKIVVPRAKYGSEAMREHQVRRYICTLMTCPNACYFMALVFACRYHHERGEEKKNTLAN